MENFFSVVSNFGFPVAVAGYLLFRFEKKLETLEQANQQLIQTNTRLIDQGKQNTDKLIGEIKRLRTVILDLKKTIK